MSQKLQITLTEEATKKYLAWASARVQAEVDEDCEPSSCIVKVDISSTWGSTAYGQESDGEVEFGDTEVELV